jgi:ATP-dependent RNA helicase DOB1
MRMEFPRDSPIWQEESNNQPEDNSDKGKQMGASTDKELRKLISVLQKKTLYPFIVFSFSRRECEAYAQFVSTPSKKSAVEPVDLNSEEEKEAVQSIFEAALQCLDEQDRHLPCIESMLPMLQRGVGVHHSGLLPILKEVVELLFQENLVKCLFSTETFAMGLNMPAKTVVFTALSKWDGQMTRPLTSGEYIQMSGRAGRRGKDDKGFTMLMVDQNLTKSQCKEMLKGEASCLNSSFKLSYYTLLNLIRSRSLGRKDDMEYVISKSFQQFQHEQMAAHLNEEVSHMKEEVKELLVPEEEIEHFYTVQSSLRVLQQEKMRILLMPDSCSHLLRPGRIVRVYAGGKDWGYGVLLCLKWLEGGQRSDPQCYQADIMLCCISTKKATIPCSLDDKSGSMLVIPVSLPCLSEISTLRIQIPSDLKDPKAKRSVKNTLKTLISRYPGERMPQLDPLRDYNIDSKNQEELKEILGKEQQLNEKIRALEQKYGGAMTGKLQEAAELQNEIRKKEVDASLSPLKKFEEEFRQRKDVLRKLGHIDMDDTVTLKGRAASQIDTGDELLITELMFDGTFGALDEHELASLLSCMVPVENSQGCPKLPLRLSNALTRLKQVAGHIYKVSTECSLDMEFDSAFCRVHHTCTGLIINPIHILCR